ncbi:hypothetical protein M5K25_021973 [Dendrobium thyrsiflorum]|uniref:Uncharacterized protein n=1 Tax=Dendrobium thyrsiflorum TaxID=117978 RepID=A0ABD0UB82_DENTH
MNSDMNLNSLLNINNSSLHRNQKLSCTQSPMPNNATGNSALSRLCYRTLTTGPNIATCVQHCAEYFYSAAGTVANYATVPHSTMPNSPLQLRLLLQEILPKPCGRIPLCRIPLQWPKHCAERHNSDFCEFPSLVFCSIPVVMFLSDMSGRSPLYKRAFVFFSSPISKELVNHIKSDASVRPRISALSEMNLEYFAIDSQGFITDHERALEELFGDTAEISLAHNASIQTIATRIATVFASLKEFPYVRYRAAKSSLDASTMTSVRDLIPTKLAAIVWHCLAKYKSSIPDFPQIETCELLILDRSVDQIAPIIHEWTYDAMCHDLLNMDGNKFVHEVPSKTGSTSEKKEVLLEDHDPIWVELRHSHIADTKKVMDHRKFSDLLNRFLWGRRAHDPQQSLWQRRPSLVVIGMVSRDMLPPLRPIFQLCLRVENVHASWVNFWGFHSSSPPVVAASVAAHPSTRDRSYQRARKFKYPYAAQYLRGNKIAIFNRMDLRNTPFTVQLGRGASIQLANATINTGNSEATIQFGELQFSLATASAAAVPVYGMDTEGPAGRPYAADVAARHVHPPPRRPQPAEVITANEFPQRRVSVFKRLSNSETPATRRVVAGKQISVLPTATTTLPTGFSVPGRNDAEASSSGGRPSRRQRRRMNAELRAQQLLQVHPSTLPAQEPEASVPTQNKFTNLKWVKRNSSTGELKQSFWEQQPQAPVPQKKKEPETLSGRVHRVLKTVKERGLMKKKYQRPLVIEARRIPPRELPPLVTRGKFKQNLQEAHRGVTLGPRVLESTAERAQQKDKQIWRPRSHERRALGKQTSMGVTSGAASQRSGPSDKSHKKWIPKKVPFDNPLDGRHPGESSRESHHQPTASSQEEASFDRSPRIEEFFMLGDEPEIQWKRRSGIRKREDDENDEETMRVEVVYMVEHDDEPPLLRVYRRQHGAGSTAGRDEDSSENEEEEEFEENPLFADAATLAEAQRQMHRQMKAKDKEIAQLNAKMTEMMTQMTMMMQMMQRNITANPIPVQQTNHQATSSGLANPPAHPVPQVSGVRGSHEGGIENDRLVRQPTPQNVASTSEPVTVAQLETIINEKIKALEGVPGVKWKSPTEPVLDLKALPIAQTSTFKQRPNQAGSSKSGKEKSPKRKTKLKKFKEKRTATQRAIDCLDEYYQTVRRPIKLADFMSELKVAEAEEADEEPFPVETCRVISVTPVAPIKDKYVNELVVEICLATSSMDYSSEEDLYFPREVESEHDITSQMEHVQLEGDSELEERKKVPHLGSDTEEEDVTPPKSQKVCQSTAKKKKKVEYSDSDYDYESTYASTVQCVFSSRIGNLSISDSVFVVTRIPMQHFKEITPREVYNVEELITFYVPPHRKRGGPGSLFYKAGEREEETCDWFHRLVDSGELIPTRMPTCNTKNIRRMLRRQANTRTSKQQLHFCLNLWYRRNPHALRRKDIVARRGLGYVVRKLLSEVQGIAFFNVTGMHSFIKPAKAESKGQKVHKFSDKSMKTNQVILQQVHRTKHRTEGIKFSNVSLDSSSSPLARNIRLITIPIGSTSYCSRTKRNHKIDTWVKDSNVCLLTASVVEPPRKKILQIKEKKFLEIRSVNYLQQTWSASGAHHICWGAFVDPDTSVKAVPTAQGFHSSPPVVAASVAAHPSTRDRSYQRARKFKYPYAAQYLRGNKIAIFNRMDLRNTPFTVQLGRGASIQLANATINTGNSEATIQFGELQFSLATASAAAVPVYGMDTEGPAGRPYAADVAARHVHPPPRRPQPAEVITANEFPQRRVSVFKRLSNSETPATRRVVAGKQISVLPTATTTLPTGAWLLTWDANSTESSSFPPRENDADIQPSMSIRGGAKIDGRDRLTDGGELSTRDLQKMVQALPQYSEQIDKLSLHVEYCTEVISMIATYDLQIAGKINKVIREVGLRELGQLEQDLVFGDAGTKDLINFLRTNQPALNLIILHWIHLETYTSSYEILIEIIMKLARLSPDDMNAVYNMRYLALPDPKKTSGGFSLKFEVHKELVEKLSKGELPKNEYQCMNDPSHSFHEATNGTPVRTSSSQPAHSMRSRRPATWARPRNSDDGYSSDSVLKYASSDFKNMGQRIFVFIIGGATRSELRVVHKLTSKFNREIILGSTSIDDPAQFITVSQEHLSHIMDAYGNDMLLLSGYFCVLI